MSWKSFVTAGLLCALATPVFANPTLRVVNGPALDAQGNWVWTVSVEEDFDGGDGLSPIAVALGFTSNRNIVSITQGAEFNDPTTASIPGNVVFPWQDLTALGGSGDCDSTTPGNCPVGVQSHLNDTATNGSAPMTEAFVALGSDTNNGFEGQQTLVTIVTEGPDNSNLTGSLQVLGSYSGEGRIAELAMVSIDGGAAEMRGLNYNGYAGTATRTLKAGDVNLDGTVNIGDFSVLQNNFNQSGKHWGTGDLNGDGTTNIGDFSILQNNFNQSGGSISNLTDTGVAVLPTGWVLAGSGGGSGGGAVPEPASLAIIALALLGGLGLVRRPRG